jgi:hypothetical protein
MDRNVSSAQWCDSSHASLMAEIDGVMLGIPNDPRNADRQAIQRWEDKGNTIAEPSAPSAPSAPEQISDVQFFQQLALQNEITQDEAEAAVSTGAIPQRIADAITHLPADEQFGARMKLKGAVVFNRHSQVTELLATLLGKSDAEVDAIWTAASAL